LVYSVDLRVGGGPRLAGASARARAREGPEAARTMTDRQTPLRPRVGEGEDDMDTLASRDSQLVLVREAGGKILSAWKVSGP